MSRHLTALLLAAGLAGCAPTVIEGDARGVVVENRSSTGIGFVGAELGYFSERARQLALEKADRHCAGFGKRAVLVARGHNAYRYDCVADAPARQPDPKG